MYNFSFTLQEFEEAVEQHMLSQQESKILELRLKGHTVIEISRIMHLSQRTINRRIKNTYFKIYGTN